MKNVLHKLPLYWLTAIVCCFCQDAFSQAVAQAVTGTVSDAKTGESLPGVNVLVKGTHLGTVTDVNGRYSIQAPHEDGILIFSSIGYTSQEVVVNGRTFIDITLVEEGMSL